MAGAFQGTRFGDMRRGFPKAILIGIVRGRANTIILCPTDNEIIREEDRLMIIAEDAKGERIGGHGDRIHRADWDPWVRTHEEWDMWIRVRGLGCVDQDT